MQRDRARRVGRRLAVGAVATVFGLAVVGTAAAVVSRPRSALPVAEVATGTAPVTRGTVAQRERFSGTLGFDGSYPITHQGEPGILTSIAAAGSTVGRGGILYAVANQPARLLYGAIPAYRGLSLGVPAGPDVRQLERNLVALGMDPYRRIVVDQRFTAATAAAVRRWQAVWGLPVAQRTGALPQGAVVFAPAALRVDETEAAVGAAIAPGAPVLTATSTNRAVLLEIPAIRQSLVHLGDRVEVTVSGVPGGAHGTVVRIGRTATAPPEQRDGGPETPPTITVIIRVTLPAGSPDLDQSPVGVLITSSTRKNVLMVPVVAVLPKPGGGYQVRLTTGQFVDVKPGVYDEYSGAVEVTGNLTAGQLVQVPA